MLSLVEYEQFCITSGPDQGLNCPLTESLDTTEWQIVFFFLFFFFQKIGSLQVCWARSIKKPKLVATLEKFYGRHHDLVNPYNIAASRIVSNVFAIDAP